MSNKETLKEFGKDVIILLLGMIAIISGACVWNAAAAGTIGTFYVVVFIINFIAEGVGIFFLCRKLFKRKD